FIINGWKKQFDTLNFYLDKIAKRMKKFANRKRRPTDYRIGGHENNAIVDYHAKWKQGQKAIARPGQRASELKLGSTRRPSLATDMFLVHWNGKHRRRPHEAI
ncbi:hypothetical protein HAX54_001877, partial [Datura stramonium]|nr:hypothetical protein [Datura stramonium]